MTCSTQMLLSFSLQQDACLAPGTGLLSLLLRADCAVFAPSTYLSMHPRPDDSEPFCRGADQPA